MKKLIVCAKNKGNTYEVCEYISQNEQIDLLIANNNKKIDINNYSEIIIASGVYLNHAHDNILEFIKNEKSNNINHKILLTWIGRGESAEKAYKQIKGELNKKAIYVDEDYLTTYGAVGFIKKNHPNKDEKNKALSWIMKSN